MKYRVEISNPAIRDAENAYLWLRDYDPDVANSWFQGLSEAVFSLESSPQRCAIAPESVYIGREVRQLLYGKRRIYRVFFGIDEESKTVSVYRVWHGSRDNVSLSEIEEGN